MILYGQHHVTRVAGGWTLPGVWAAALAEGGVVTVGLDGCLWLYPASSWRALVERISPRLTLTGAVARDFSRRLFGQAHPVTLQEDRLSLPEWLCRLADIGDELVLVGMIDHLELWSPPRWQAQLERAGETWEAELAGLGI